MNRYRPPEGFVWDGETQLFKKTTKITTPNKKKALHTYYFNAQTGEYTQSLLAIKTTPAALKLLQVLLVLLLVALAVIAGMVLMGANSLAFPSQDEIAALDIFLPFASEAPTFGAYPLP